MKGLYTEVWAELREQLGRVLHPGKPLLCLGLKQAGKSNILEPCPMAAVGIQSGYWQGCSERGSRGLVPLLSFPKPLMLPSPNSAGSQRTDAQYWHFLWLEVSSSGHEAGLSLDLGWGRGRSRQSGKKCLRQNMVTRKDLNQTHLITHHPVQVPYRMKKVIINNHSRSIDKTKTVWHSNRLFQLPQFAYEDTDEPQRGKATRGKLPSRSGTEVDKALTAGTQAEAFESSPLSCPAKHAHRRLQCSHDSGKKAAHSSVPRSMQFGARLSLIFFFPFFVVKYWAGWRGSTQVSGASLLAHYVSESTAQRRMNVKHSHLTGASPGPGRLSHAQSSVPGNTRSVFLTPQPFLEHPLRVRHYAVHMVHESGRERRGHCPRGGPTMDVSGCWIIGIYTNELITDTLSARQKIECSNGFNNWHWLKSSFVPTTLWGNTTFSLSYWCGNWGTERLGHNPRSNS